MKNLRVSVGIACAATGLVILVLLFTLRFALYQQGTLIALCLTLLAVIWYTYFTHQLAEKKEHPAIVASIQYIPEAKDVRVLLHNPTNRYAATRLWVEAKVYGNTTSLGPAYSGETIWHLTPQFAINGHFSLEKPLRQVGKQFATMVAEANSENCTRQLRLSLRLEWEDEDGISGSYPQHLWYFDFRRNGFVYQVGGFES